MATHTSHYIKTVSLKDWWLTKAENNSLNNTVAVSGIESTGQAARAFFSAPIVDRLGFSSLKTADGIFVLLRSLINKEKTRENGFSEEVFKYFSMGFPSNWMYCTEKCLQRSVDSKANADADLNPAKANAWKDLDSNNTPEHFTDEAQEVTSELQDEQNIDSVEERKDLDSNNTHECFTVEGQVAASELQDDQNIDSVEDNKALDPNNMHEPLTAETQEATIELQDAQNIELVDGARYSLRNREVLYCEAKGACKGKHVKNHAKSKATSVVSHHSFVEKSCESKKRKRIQTGTSQKNVVRNISLSKKTGERTDAFATTLVTVLPAQGNSTRPAPRSCTSKAKINSKAAAPGIEGKASTGGTSMLQTRRKLDYVEKTTCTAEKENKTPTSQSSVIRTSRSGRLLLPPMEFWRNQLPIYDADHGISGIKEGSTILKLNRD